MRATNTPLEITLIMATKGRRKELTRFLAGLRNQTFPRFHLLIADQNPPGFLEPIITPHAQNLDIQLIQTPEGASVSRNVCLQRPLAPVVGFPDDDCWYAPDTLAQVVRWFHQLRCAGLVGCHPEWRQRNVTRTPKRLGRVSVFRHTPTWVSFLSRESVMATGGFDVDLGPGPHARFASGEDTDYLMRMMSKGFALYRCPHVVVHHPEPDMEDEYVQAKAHAYGRGRAYLLQKHHCGLDLKAMNLLYPLAKLFDPRRTKGERTYFRNMFLGRLRQLIAPTMQG